MARLVNVYQLCVVAVRELPAPSPLVRERRQAGKHFEKKLAEIVSHPVNYFHDFPRELGSYKNKKQIHTRTRLGSDK